MLQNNIIRKNNFLILQYNAYLWVLIHFSPNNIVRKYYSLSIVYLLKQYITGMLYNNKYICFDYVMFHICIHYLHMFFWLKSTYMF
jgi:hypothetical protein